MNNQNNDKINLIYMMILMLILMILYVMSKDNDMEHLTVTQTIPYIYNGSNDVRLNNLTINNKLVAGETVLSNTGIVSGLNSKKFSVSSEDGTISVSSGVATLNTLNDVKIGNKSIIDSQGNFSITLPNINTTGITIGKTTINQDGSIDTKSNIVLGESLVVLNGQTGDISTKSGISVNSDGSIAGVKLNVGGTNFVATNINLTSKGSINSQNMKSSGIITVSNGAVNIGSGTTPTKISTFTDGHVEYAIGNSVIYYGVDGVMRRYVP